MKTSKRWPLRLRALLLPTLLWPWLSGCVGYRLGSMLPPDIASVYVPTCVNQTDEPLLEIECTDALLERLQTDGSLRIENEDRADAELIVVLKSFDLTPIGFQTTEASRADEYRARITASVLLTRRSTGAVLVHHPTVTGDATFTFVGDLTSQKRAIQPEVAESLARMIVKTVVETW